MSSPYRVGIEPRTRIVVTTGNEIAGHRIVDYLGVVRGIVVRSLNIGQGIVGAFKQLAGGNIREYETLCETARHQAYAQLLAHAESLGADAIIGMRYDATECAQGTTEGLA